LEQWHTVVGHTNEFLSLSADRKVMRLGDTLADGLVGPRGVPRTDVNPRPLSRVVPSNGLKESPVSRPDLMKSPASCTP